jgi:DNA-binding NtrC family response regulator
LLAFVFGMTHPDRGFTFLHERIVDASFGVVVARVASNQHAIAVTEHIRRRVRAIAIPSPLEGMSSWHEVASRLAITFEDNDPVRCARTLAVALAVKRVVVVAFAPAPETWDHAVALELAHLDAPPRVVLLATTSLSSELRIIDVEPALNENEKRLWLEALCDHARQTMQRDDLISLEEWWSSRSNPRTTHPSRDSLRGGISLFATLAGIGGPITMYEARTLADEAVVQSLIDSGLLVAEGDRMWIHPASAESARGARETASMEALCEIAIWLQTHRASDPWAMERAAELLLATGETTRARQIHEHALDLAAHPIAQSELMTKWMDHVAQLPNDDAKIELHVHAISRALRAGWIDVASRWSKTAFALAPKDASVAVLFAHTAIAMGDPVAAEVALKRALHCPTEHVRRAARAARAEAAFVRRDYVSARAEAEAALRGAVGELFLSARNTLGKILLAEGCFDEANEHFTEDALYADSVGAPDAAMRAEINRGIALACLGRTAEARHTLTTALSTAQGRGNLQAQGFAVENLGFVAWCDCDYASALAHAEQAFLIWQRLGNRVKTASSTANLANFRRHLGLFDEARHAIAFGRRMLGQGAPSELAAQFEHSSALIALETGDTRSARLEIARSVEQGGGSTTDRGDALRVMARIAIEDGDVARAEAALEAARELATTGAARAEIALLAAYIDRAKGLRCDVGEALAAARAARAHELVREGELLASKVLLSEGNVDDARRRLNVALELRERIAATLPPRLRESYLARPDIAALDVHARACVDLKEQKTPGHVRTVPQQPRIIGDHPAIRGLLAAIRKVAASETTVLVHGESGTGKEIVAEELHRQSHRSRGPLIKVNCGALADTLLLSELFGHEKGAFTGAVARRRGRFELAEGGTLFLDEIGDISMRAQVALLRAVQERTFERVGSTTTQRASVRLVCATHRDLGAMVARGEFREDLYYRLREITLEIPPLRERLADLPKIAMSLLERVAAERRETCKSLSRDAIATLMEHAWPGNVRELENALRAASLFADSDLISARDLALAAEHRPPAVSAPTECERVESDSHVARSAYECVRRGDNSLSVLKQKIERECIAHALAETSGNITRAAALLGMKRPRLSQLVKQHGLAALGTDE